MLMTFCMMSFAAPLVAAGPPITMRDTKLSNPMAYLSSFQLGKSDGGDLDVYQSIGVERWSGQFFDEDGERIKRLWATRTNVRTGVRFSKNFSDLSLGVRLTHVDSVEDPRVYHSNPDVTWKINALRTTHFDVPFYTTALFYVSPDDLDPTAYAEGGKLEEDMARAEEVTVIAGVSPTARGAMFGATWFLNVDARAIKYSKSHTYPTREGRPNLDERITRYAHKWTTGAKIDLGPLMVEASAAYDTRHVPYNYYDICLFKWDYWYQVERVSYTALKAELGLSPSFTITAEHQYIRDGFFNEDRVGTKMRFKDVVSILVNF